MKRQFRFNMTERDFLDQFTSDELDALNTYCTVMIQCANLHNQINDIDLITTLGQCLIIKDMITNDSDTVNIWTQSDPFTTFRVIKRMMSEIQSMAADYNAERPDDDNLDDGDIEFYDLWYHYYKVSTKFLTGTVLA